jgi:crotonobetaine/carnitine-CoA ligase
MQVPADGRTLPALLTRRAELSGDRDLLRVGDHARSAAFMAVRASRLAGAFASRGVRAGDRVAVLSESRVEVIDALAACGWLGASLVPINTAARGPQLTHILTNAAPRVLVAEAALLDRLQGLDTLPESLEWLWSFDDHPSHLRGRPVEDFPSDGEPIPAAELTPADTLAVLYTSGTTGPSKGVCCPHGQFYWWGVNTGAALDVHEGDVLYTCLPLFHTNALNAFLQALVHGATLVVGPRFSASRFFDDLAAGDADVTYLLGAMVSMLCSRPPSSAERRHHARVALAPATPAELWQTCRDRFGISIVEAHGMTETNLAIGPRDGLQVPGAMGRVMPGFHARVVDENDVEVIDGTPGELVLRADEPFAFATGYWQMPDATISCFRNLWLHTGDRVVRDDDGWYRFLDRLKDAIRRRGENVSSWEVEQVIVANPAVAAAAVVPVPSELGEDDVMAFVVPAHDHSAPTPHELLAHCEQRLAYFAVPRYIEMLDELPMTSNGKVQKHVLRQRGVSASTFDREKEGFHLRRA